MGRTLIWLWSTSASHALCLGLYQERRDMLSLLLELTRYWGQFNGGRGQSIVSWIWRLAAIPSCSEWEYYRSSNRSILRYSFYPVLSLLSL